jgi:uncharacterized protein (TIGR04255 family)
VQATPSSAADVKVRELPRLTHFSSTDEQKVIRIGPRILTVSELRPYSNWEVFRARISQAFTIYADCVRSTEVERIGIRYVNKIRIPGVGPIVMAEYFSCVPQDLSDLKDEHLPKYLSSLSIQQRYRYADGAGLVLSFGKAQEKDDYQAFLLDIDAFQYFKLSELPLGEVEAVIEKLRARERTAFDASITELTRGLFNADSN